MYSFSFVDSTTGVVQSYQSTNMIPDTPSGQTRIDSLAPGLEYKWNFGTLAWEAYVDPNAAAQEALDRRNHLLFVSDYTQLADSTQPGTKAEWATYRQELRDLPEDPNWPDVTWPTPPTG